MVYRFGSSRSNLHSSSCECSSNARGCRGKLLSLIDLRIISDDQIDFRLAQKAA